MNYDAFIKSKADIGGMSGFEPTFLPDDLFDFQQSLVEWAIRKGKAAIFADCGLGKTLMQLVWAQNVVEKTNMPVLIATPLAVAQQTKREAEKFGIDAEVSRDGRFSGKIVITNYEKMHLFDEKDFSGMVCDESSGIKNFNSKRRQTVTEFMRRLKYRLLCTATAAPNDFFELGTSSEALGCLGFRDMLTKFFVQETEKDYLGWGRAKYRFRGHAESHFWRWICSWARACRTPSDLGFSDDRFDLPPLTVNEILVEHTRPRAGQLFSTPAKSLQEQREERRSTLTERCDAVASRINGDPTVVWCHLNPEGDRLASIIPGAMQVSGSMSDEKKEERLAAFSSGELKVLITKPKIGCWGLNWQHCSDVFMFPSHSFEQYYQAVRRCWRFGQKNPVTVNVITTEGEAGVMKNLQRKADQAEQMFDNLVQCMNDELHINSTENFPTKEDVPSWL